MRRPCGHVSETLNPISPQTDCKPRVPKVYDTKSLHKSVKPHTASPYIMHRGLSFVTTSNLHAKGMQTLHYLYRPVPAKPDKSPYSTMFNPWKRPIQPLIKDSPQKNGTLLKHNPKLSAQSKPLFCSWALSVSQLNSQNP